MSKTGIFMGSFDPPHIGHIGITTAVLNSNLIDHIIVVPAWKNLWKNTKTSYIDRFNMCTKSFLGERITVSDVEQILSPEYPNGVPSYKVIEHFRNLFKDSLYIIVTQETLHEISNWIFGDNILMDNKFIVVNNYYHNNLIPSLACITMPKVQISSTYIREELSKSNEVYPYITEKVKLYINEHNLYK